MDESGATLRERLDRFRIDEPTVALPFTRRLARDNAWPLAYAQRVVREYKRFAWLAVRAGHPVTPSDDVDQAWHLHLVYTESYARFCAEVLGCQLHHHPTRGGLRERAKFRDWYERTLQRYQACFGQEAPVDVWPSCQRRFAHPSQYARVNTRRNWIVPKPRFALAPWDDLTAFGPQILVRARRLAWTLALACGVASCAWLGTVPPFDWSGGSFLMLFLFVWWFSFRLAHGRVEAASALPADSSVPALGAYEIAYLAGGADRGVAAVLANLLQSGTLSYDADRKGVRCTSDPKAHADPIERAIWTDVAGGTGDLSRLRQRAVRHFAPTVKRLEALGLLGDIPLGALLLALMAPVLGFIRIAFSLARDEPVLLLTVLSVIATISAFKRFGVRQHRSPLGNAVLSQLREEHADLKQNWQDGPRVDGTTAGMACALFGGTVLLNADLGPLADLLTGSDGVDDGADAGDGDAGGDGDSGGGCGGCGGCGGGGD